VLAVVWWLSFAHTGGSIDVEAEAHRPFITTTELCHLRVDDIDVKRPNPSGHRREGDGGQRHRAAEKRHPGHQDVPQGPSPKEHAEAVVTDPLVHRIETQVKKRGLEKLAGRVAITFSG
jgi:hypothetical protein